MCQYILFAVVSCAVFSTTAAGDDDLKKLQGSWLVVETELDGKSSSAVNDQSVWTFQKDTLSSTLRGKFHGSGGVVKLSAKLTPKSIDIDITDPEDAKGVKLIGIYEFSDEKTLRLAFSQVNEKRPTEFSTKSGGKHRLLVLKRLKGSDLAASAPKPIYEGNAEKYASKTYELPEGDTAFTMTFPAGNKATITFKSPSDEKKENDVNLYVYDGDNELILKDESPGPTCEVSFQIHVTSKYTLIVTNKGSGTIKSVMKVTLKEEVKCKKTEKK